MKFKILDKNRNIIKHNITNSEVNTLINSEKMTIEDPVTKQVRDIGKNELIFMDDTGQSYAMSEKGVLKKIDNDNILEETLTEIDNADSYTEILSRRSQNRNMFESSGVVSYGKYNSEQINKDMWCRDANSGFLKPNYFVIGYPDSSSEKYDKVSTNEAKYNIDGDVIKLVSTGWGENVSGAVIRARNGFLPKIVNSLYNTNTDIKAGDGFVLSSKDNIIPNNGIFNANMPEWKNRVDSPLKSIDISDGKLTYVAGDDKYGLCFIRVKTIPGVRYRIKLDIESAPKGVRVLLVTDLNSSDSGHIGSGMYDKDSDDHKNGTTFTAVRGDYVLSLGFNYKDHTIEEDDKVILNSITMIPDNDQNAFSYIDIPKGSNLMDFKNYWFTQDTMSNTDMVILEKWEEYVDLKDVVYPYGNVQFINDPSIDFFPNVSVNIFDGYETYSKYHDNDDLIGMSYKWTTLDKETRNMLLSNPEHKLYMHNGRLAQTRHRIRVIKTTGDRILDKHVYDSLKYSEPSTADLKPQGPLVLPSNVNTDYKPAYHRRYHKAVDSNDTDPGILRCFLGGGLEDIRNAGPNTQYIDAIPLAVISNINYGVYHPVYNKTGTSLYFKDGKMYRYEDLNISEIRSISDCFNTDNIAVVDVNDRDDIISLTEYNNKTVKGSYVITGFKYSLITSHPYGIYCDKIGRHNVRDIRFSANTIKDNESIINDTIINNPNNIYMESTKITKEFHMDDNGLYSTGGSDDSKNQNFSIYVSSGIDDYVLRRHFGMDYHSKFKDKLIFMKDSKYLRTFINKDNRAKYFRDDFEYGTSDNGLHGMYGRRNGILLSVEQAGHKQYGREIYYTEIFGDIRSVGERVEAQVTSGSDVTGYVIKGYTVKVDDTYYISRNDRGSISLDPDDEDYTDASRWINMGTDGDYGGLPKEWRLDGVHGDYNVTMSEKSMHHNVDRYGWNIIATRITNDGGKAIGYVPMKKTMLDYDYSSYYHFKKAIAVLPNGTINTLTNNASWDDAKDGNPVVWGYNEINGGNSKIAYNPGTDNLKEIMGSVVFVHYKAYADVEHYPSGEQNYNEVPKLLYFSKWKHDAISASISGKKLCGRYSDTSFGKIISPELNTTSTNLYTSHYDRWPVEYSEKIKDYISKNIRYDAFNNCVVNMPYIITKYNKIYLYNMFKTLDYQPEKLIHKDPSYQILVNGRGFDARYRSYTVLSINPKFTEFNRDSFDVYGSSDNATKMKDFLNNIPRGNYVIIVSWDEPKTHMHDNDDLKDAMVRCGATREVLTDMDYHGAYALIGIKDKTKGIKIKEEVRTSGQNAIYISETISGYKIDLYSWGMSSPRYKKINEGWHDNLELYNDSSMHNVRDVIDNYVKAGTVYIPLFIPSKNIKV